MHAVHLQYIVHTYIALAALTVSAASAHGDHFLSTYSYVCQWLAGGMPAGTAGVNSVTSKPVAGGDRRLEHQS